MSKNAKIPLTDVFSVDMKVSIEEMQMIENLRHYAKLFKHADFQARIKMHDGRYKSGTLNLGETTVKL